MGISLKRRMRRALPWMLLPFAAVSPGKSSSPKAETISVRHYGARGDGMADDTGALQRALRSGAKKGATIDLPCGIYRITASLEVATSNLSIRGSGECTTLKIDGRNSFAAIKVAGRGLGPAAKLVRDTTGNNFTVGSGELARLGITSGSYVVISDEAVASNGRESPMTSTQQVALVSSVHGDTATIEGGLAHNFTLVSPHPQNQGCCPYVQKILAPVRNVSLTNFRIDGALNMGSESEALELDFAVDSEIGSLRVENFAASSGRVSGIRVDTGYHNHFHDISCTACGNGGGVSFWLFRQSLLTLEKLSIVNSSAQSEVFGFTASQLTNSTVSDLTVNAGGSKGRPFKLARTNHTTFDRISVMNGAGAMNGISITDMSSYNTFHDCSALNNVQTGIMMFGNFNQHNTFVNCTAKGNTVAQFGQGKDAFGNYGDDFTTIEGGDYCCATGRDGTIIWIRSDHFSMTKAIVRDDKGFASAGLVIFGKDSIVKDNRFDGIPRGKAVQIVESPH